MVDTVFAVLQGRGQGKSHCLSGRRTGLLHMLTHHGQRIPVWHPLAAIADVIEQNATRTGE